VAVKPSKFVTIYKYSLHYVSRNNTKACDSLTGYIKAAAWLPHPGVELF